MEKKLQIGLLVVVSIISIFAIYENYNQKGTNQPVELLPGANYLKEDAIALQNIKILVEDQTCATDLDCKIISTRCSDCGCGTPINKEYRYYK